MFIFFVYSLYLCICVYLWSLPCHNSKICKHMQHFNIYEYFPLYANIRKHVLKYNTNTDIYIKKEHIHQYKTICRIYTNICNHVKYLCVFVIYCKRLGTPLGASISDFNLIKSIHIYLYFFMCMCVYINQCYPVYSDTCKNIATRPGAEIQENTTAWLRKCWHCKEHSRWQLGRLGILTRTNRRSRSNRVLVRLAMRHFE